MEKQEKSKFGGGGGQEGRKGIIIQSYTSIIIPEIQIKL